MKFIQWTKVNVSYVAYFCEKKRKYGMLRETTNMEVQIMTLTIGEKAPDFTLSNQAGEQVRLSDYKGKKVVLYFYPKDMTPGCTTQACDFRDSHEQFADLNAVILGVSPDPIERHEKFIEKYNLPFHLLADEDHKVSETYGVWQLKKTFGNEYYGIVRSTFIIDEAGNLLKDFRNIRVKGHIDRMLTYVKEQTTS